MDECKHISNVAQPLIMHSRAFFCKNGYWAAIEEAKEWAKPNTTAQLQEGRSVSEGGSYGGGKSVERQEVFQAKKKKSRCREAGAPLGCSMMVAVAQQKKIR